MSKLEAEVVRKAAQERGWMDIHDKLIGGKLDGRIFQKVPGKGRSACPIHGTSQRNGRGDGFRFFRDAETSGGGVCNTCGKYGDGFALLMAVHGWSFQEALGEVARVLGIEEGRCHGRTPLPPRSRPKAEPKARNDSYIRGLLRRAWMESVPLSDPSAAPALRYLMRRRLSVEPLAELKNFRFHPALDYVDEDGVVVGQFPALLMGVSDALGRAATMHRTYLSQTGEKAPVDEPKKLFPLPNDRALITSIPHPRFQEMMVEAGGYIRMGEPQNGVLGVAEGFETALSIHLATGMTVWPCVSADLLERFVPPEGVEQLVIWGDLDRSGRGRDAAQRLKVNAWDMGIKAQVFMPSMSIPDDKKGVDWNDVWLMHGQAGFPQIRVGIRVAMPAAVGEVATTYLETDEEIHLEPSSVVVDAPAPVVAPEMRGEERPASELVADRALRAPLSGSGFLSKLRGFLRF